MRVLCVILLLLCLTVIPGCASRPEISSSETEMSSSASTNPPLEDWDPVSSGKDTIETINDVLAELGVKVGFEKDIFTDDYTFNDFKHVSVYYTRKWVGLHFNETVALLYLKDEKRFQVMDLGAYFGLKISWIRETQDPDILNINFDNPLFSFGLGVYVRSFIDNVDYSISQDRIVDRNYMIHLGSYGLNDPLTAYVQQFKNCEVIDKKKAALRFEVLYIENGFPSLIDGAEIILARGFERDTPSEILLPHVAMNLSQELLDEMNAMEGIESLTAQKLQTGDMLSGTRFIITPKPGYQVSCGFDSEEVEGWESTFYLYAEKAEESS